MVLPTETEIKEHFGVALIEIEYMEGYPAVEVLTKKDGLLQLWKWDRWHGGGGWWPTCYSVLDKEK